MRLYQCVRRSLTNADRLLKIMATLDIPDLWTPTRENLDALPEPLRRYIHDLQANADPVGPMRESFRLRQEIAALRKQLAGKLDERGPFFADHFFWPRS